MGHFARYNLHYLHFNKTGVLLKKKAFENSKSILHLDRKRNWCVPKYEPSVYNK